MLQGLKLGMDVAEKYMKQNKGQALVEFILVLPLIMMIIFVVIDFSNVFYQKNKLEDEKEKNLENFVQKVDDIFTIKRPIVTNIIIGINVFLFVLTLILGKDIMFIFGANYGPLVANGQFYRLITSAFLHADIIHLLTNMYALYVIGRQIESFYGKTKYLTIYILSAIIGNIFSLAFGFEVLSVGASGAIFGLLGSLLYFGYHYRIYLGNVMKSQIIPTIILNLFIGLMISSINLSAHIGGLIAGILISMALGVKGKSQTSDKVNGIIMSIIFIAFSFYLAFFR